MLNPSPRPSPLGGEREKKNQQARENMICSFVWFVYFAVDTK